jgi:hypothetical protein
LKFGQILWHGLKLPKRICGPKIQKVTVWWRKLSKFSKLHNVYFSLNIVHAIKVRRMKWGQHVRNIGQMRNYSGQKKSSKETYSEMTA